MSSLLAPPTVNCSTVRHGGVSKSARSLTPTSRAQATRYLAKLAARFGGDLGYAPRTIADKLTGASYAELEEFAVNVRRRAVLALPDADLRRIVQERLEHWHRQATE